jgi:glycosyltransferase involved in cell wall biosynthesis
MKYFVPRFDFIFVLTTFLRDYFIKTGVDKSRIILIPNFVDLETFQYKPGENKSLFFNNKFVVGYCGSPYRKDGILDLLEAFRKFSSSVDAHLLIIGDMPGKDTLLPGLLKIAKELGLESKITFTGLVPFSEIPALLGLCSVLVLARPSGRFADAGFPTKLGEYFASRKPVIITSVGDIPYYFEDERELLIAQPDNPGSICEKLSRLYHDEALAVNISETGYNWAAENLEFRKNAKRIIDFIEKN